MSENFQQSSPSYTQCRQHSWLHPFSRLYHMSPLAFAFSEQCCVWLTSNNDAQDNVVPYPGLTRRVPDV